MNVEIQKSLHPHISAFDIVVDGIAWGTVHREYKSRYGTRYWFKSFMGPAIRRREYASRVYVWSGSRRGFPNQEDRSPATLLSRLLATAKQLIDEGLIISPDTAKAEQEVRKRQLAAAASLNGEERMKKLRMRAEVYFRRFQVYASPIMIEALAKEFVAVINAGL